MNSHVSIMDETTPDDILVCSLLTPCVLIPLLRDLKDHSRTALALKRGHPAQNLPRLQRNDQGHKNGEGCGERMKEKERERRALLSWLSWTVCFESFDVSLNIVALG